MDGSPAPPPASRRRGRLQFLLVAALFFGPLALAFYLYYGGAALRPGGTVNRGELLMPTRTLPAVALATSATTTAALLRGKWSLVYLGTQACGADCRKALATTRGVRLTLGRNLERVQRILLLELPCCEGAPGDALAPDGAVAWIGDAAAAPLRSAFPADATAPGARRLYLVDPRGNLVMRYPGDVDPKDVIRDLERLLRLSHIG